MNKHPLFRTILLITFLTLSVYLGFRYLLPLFLPFLVAIFFMNLLSPITDFLQSKLHFSKCLSTWSCFLVFWFLLGGALFFLGWQICKQSQLLLTNFPIYRQIYGDLFSEGLRNCCHSIDYYLSMEDGSSLLFVTNQLETFEENYFNSFLSNAGKILSFCFSNVIELFSFFLVLFISMILLGKEGKSLQEAFHTMRYHSILSEVLHIMRDSGVSYIKSQFIIILVNWIVCSIGLFFIKNPYFILIGFLISIIDAFPVLGSGLILLPYGIYHLLNHNFLFAAILFTVYLITLFARELLESRLLGNKMQLPAFYIFVSIYIGLKLFGILGIFLGPIGLVLIRTLYQKFQEPLCLPIKQTN